MPEIDKAEHFKSLHVAGNPLVVYNIWDAGSAMCLAQQGATAIATGSLSVGASQGFADGEVIPLQRALETAQQIAQSVDIPVSLDFEGGYARDPETLKANIKAVIATGVIGINLEDQIVKGTGLYALTEQVARLKAVRHAAESHHELYISYATMAGRNGLARTGSGDDNARSRRTSRSARSQASRGQFVHHVCTR